MASSRPTSANWRRPGTPTWTWGRIQALEVKVSHNLVVVRGRAPNYYVEQLALQGVLDVIESAGAMRIELNIQIGSPTESTREAL